MRNDAPYVNDNFSWFAARYSAFVYVDRIVVSASFGRNKLGSLLYTDLFAYARANRLPLVTCEYNIIPPNEPSRRFHDKFGFEEVGTQWVSNGAKRVSLQAAETR
jgi:predicted GNAT superfamily acetyltransferase